MSEKKINKISKHMIDPDYTQEIDGKIQVLSEDVTGVTQQLADTAVNARSFGLDENATWQVNRDAIQAANDHAYAQGGGSVLIPHGVFDVKGVYQDSHVEIIGNGATLRHPDGIGADIIRSRVYEATGNITKGSKTLTLSDVSKVEEGSVVAIRGAGGILVSQRTTLIDAVDNIQTAGFKIAVTTGFLNNGYLQIGEEIIRYTGLSGNELTGVVRGMYGTSPSAHVTGKEIGVVSRLYAEVTKVEGNTVTLYESALLGVSNAEVSVGAIAPKMKNLKLDGNRVQGGAPSEVHPLKWELTRFGLIDDVTVKDGEAGFMIRHGNRDLVINRPTFIDCSVPEKSFGSGGWLFRANQRCHYRDVTAIGAMWTGLYFDDRTSIGSEWDGQNIDCTAHGFYMRLDRLAENLGAVNVGGIRCSMTKGKVDGPRTGFACTSNSQGVGYPLYNSVDCVYSDIEMVNVFQPAIIGATRTKIRFVTYDDATTANRQFVDTSTDTVYESSGGGEARTLLRDGNTTTPSIAYTKDPTTGFYRITDGQVQFVSKGVASVRFHGAGLMFAEGKDFSTGTVTGTRIGTARTQKLGFWGQPPTTRPIGMPKAANDLESAITLLNYIRTAMYSIGLADIEE